MTEPCHRSSKGAKNRKKKKKKKKGVMRQTFLQLQLSLALAGMASTADRSQSGRDAAQTSARMWECLCVFAQFYISAVKKKSV